MYKAGANQSDKNRICKLALQGLSVEQITSLTLVRPENVKAVVAQFKAGKIKPGKVEYGKGDFKENAAALGGTDSAEVADLREENASLRDVLGKQQEQIDQILAAQSSGGAESASASDAAAALAEEHGIDLSSIKGTGANGNITKSDVETAIEAGNSGGE